MDITELPGYVSGFPHEKGVRELGGQRTRDGRLVRHGLFYRGSALVGLRPQEQACVDAFGLRHILDLRAEGEVGGFEDYVPAGARLERIAGMYDEGEAVDFSQEGVGRIIQRMGDPETFMRHLYASMMFDNPAVHALVSWVANGEVPVYFHCSAGKDRTGVCAAVLLMLLGVSDVAIMDEYLLTNEYRAEVIRDMMRYLPTGMEPVTREEWEKMAGVSRENLQAALDAVDERYATREAYFETEFGLDERALAVMRGRYLVSTSVTGDSFSYR